MKLATVVRKYVLLRRATGMRFRTQTEYLDAFCRAMGNIHVHSVQPEAVSAFLRGRGPMTRSWHDKYSTLKMFYRFAIGRGFATTSPLPTTIPQQPPALSPYIYSLGELRRILDRGSLLRNRDTDVPPLSVRALILLLYGAGLRISEALALTIVQVDLQNAVVTIREGKFYKDRLVPISSGLAAELEAYARRRRRWPCPQGVDSTFFAMLDGRALKRDSIEDIWRRLCDAAGVRTARGPRGQPRLHDLRHSFAVHRLIAWYREGADVQRLIYFLQVYLGHEKLAHTQRYLTMTPDLLGHANRRFESYVSKEVKHA